MSDRQDPRPYRRHPSGQRAASRISPDLRSALDRYEDRWSAAAIAAACTLPDTARSTVLGWASLLDRLDDVIRDVVCE